MTPEANLKPRQSFARSEKWRIMQFLATDLYRPDYEHERNAQAGVDGHEHGVTVYVSPLKWVCVIGGPLNEPWVEILRPTDGVLYRRLDRATAETLDGGLP